ncbi:hypothetical protein GCK72_012089 [Caenorhabditis remanei]|uniref:Uncharacterized protein n=1 Tax=Caenorhabditis remanei TaxID=31234 RepID=E3NBB2_CAERE|nr:hypothetical protein GCK72_012089 [Caenorhabditis remanei]EFO91910.1 hypothetical protein CRE_12267 [Caenorhabditis remanei]KAF1755639.1 hypothetical protein GCK72_012089 [Caenorhabditis remanei]
MRIVAFSLVAFLALISSSDGAKIATKILEEMDKSLESKDHEEFLKMHADDFHFTFCDSVGKSREDLKKILEKDPNMSSAVKSKHFQKGPLVREDNVWQFKYDEYLLLKNNELYRTEGIINFLPGPKIQSAKEKCPVKVF